MGGLKVLCEMCQLNGGLNELREVWMHVSGKGEMACAKALWWECAWNIHKKREKNNAVPTTVG